MSLTKLSVALLFLLVPVISKPTRNLYSHGAPIDKFSAAEPTIEVTCNQLIEFRTNYQKLEEIVDSIESNGLSNALCTSCPEYLRALSVLGERTPNFFHLTRAKECWSTDDRESKEWFNLLNRRGQLAYILKKYHDAREDLDMAAKIAPNDLLRSSVNFILGKSLYNTGCTLEALDVFKKALLFDENATDTWFWIGVTESVLGRETSAFERVYELDPNHKYLYEFWGTYLVDMGMYRKALEVLPKCTIDKCRFLVGVSHHALGDYIKALEIYPPGFLREWALIQTKYLNHSLDDMYIKACAEFPSDLKNGWSHNKPPREFKHLLSDVVNIDVARIENHECDATWDDVLTLFHYAKRFSSFYQINSDGFKANRRQLIAMSFAVIDIFQRTDMSYRDAIDVLAKWRSVSAPHEGVFWSHESTYQGRSTRSRTRITMGDFKVIRYYPYYERCLAKMREILARSRLANTTSRRRAILEDCKNITMIADWVGKSQFYAITRVTPPEPQQKPVDGTALMYEDANDVSILTMHDDKRWQDYHRIMTHIWHQYPDETRILQLFHIWCNFMPLSRGTAGLGLALMQGMMLSIGKELSTPLPRGVQLDWEALLTTNTDDFVRLARGLIKPQVAHDNDALPLVKNVFPTARVAISALNRIIDEGIQ